MSVAQARRVQESIHLGQLVTLERVQVRGGASLDSGGVRTWAKVEAGREELAVSGRGTTLRTNTAVIVRYDSRWATTGGTSRLRCTLPNRTEADSVGEIEVVGRRRYLRLELGP